MIIHGQTIDPTTITRLRIVHRDGELDLGGAHAVEAMRAIRRVQTTGGKVGRPSLDARPAVLRAMARPAGFVDAIPMTLARIAADAGIGVASARNALGQLVADGEVTIGSAPQRRGAPLKTYKLAT